MKKRRSRATDQENTQIAYDLLCETVQNNPKVEVSLWFGAMASALAQTLIKSGASYEEFCRILDDLKLYYKSHFEDKDLSIIRLSLDRLGVR
jgi:hypothetical protein